VLHGHSCRPCPETRFAVTDRKRAVSAPHSPRENHLLAALPLKDYERVNELTMTHELIADMLGVRRESVTETAGELQEAGLIQCRRGHIAVLDRRQLEAQVCECYAIVKREYGRLLSGCRQAELAS
jgi:Crp-like helix-turn-helix protein